MTAMMLKKTAMTTMMLKITEKNRQKIQALIIAEEIGKTGDKRDAQDFFDACRAAEKSMNHEIAHNDRHGASMLIYPPANRVGTCARLIRQRTGWFLEKVWRMTGNVAQSGVRLHVPHRQGIVDYGRRI